MIITLLTDFGTEDYFVGAVKGAILSVNQEANIVDVTHDIAPQDVRAAAFTLLNYYRTFPPGTVHLSVVDPGVGSSRRAILVETGDYFFIAPDNGLLSFVFAEENNFRVFELTNKKFFRHPVSQTFHGRDIFAPVASYLTKGISANEFGREIKDFVHFEIIQPQWNSENEFEAQIIQIDRFGNLITNLKPENLPENFLLQIRNHKIEKRQRYYSEAEHPGEVFSILGSAGFLEVAAFRDSAKKLLNVEIGEKIRLLNVVN